MAEGFPLVISVHYPKAGGTSLRHALQRAYGCSFAEDYSDDPALPDSAVHFDPEGYFARQHEIPAHVRCIHGHFHAAKYGKTDNMVWFTVLRHPIDVMLSIYFYWLTVPPGGVLHRYMLEERLDIVGVARIPQLRRLMSQTYFGGVDMAKFDLIGRYERREQTLKVLSSHIGRRLVDERVNVTGPSARRAEAEADPSLRATLTDLLSDDIAFYEQHAFRDVA